MYSIIYFIMYSIIYSIMYSIMYSIFFNIEYSVFCLLHNLILLMYYFSYNENLYFNDRNIFIILFFYFRSLD